MIPNFDADGNLPPGIHDATWYEIAHRFGETSRRSALLVGLHNALALLSTAGCSRAFLDGSFVTAKKEPGDFDVCWDVMGVDACLLDPVLLDFSEHRRAQKDRFGGELFPADSRADGSGKRFLEYFQRDRNTGKPKGIVRIDLEGLE